MSDTCASVNMKYEDHEIVIREAVVEDMEEVAGMIQVSLLITTLYVTVFRLLLI